MRISKLKITGQHHFICMIVLLVCFLMTSISDAQSTPKKRRPPARVPPPINQVSQEDNKFCLVDYVPIDPEHHFHIFYKRRYYRFCCQKCVGLFRLKSGYYVARWQKIKLKKIPMITEEEEKRKDEEAKDDF